MNISFARSLRAVKLQGSHLSTHLGRPERSSIRICPIQLRSIHKEDLKETSRFNAFFTSQKVLGITAFHQASRLEEPRLSRQCSFAHERSSWPGFRILDRRKKAQTLSNLSNHVLASQRTDPPQLVFKRLKSSASGEEKAIGDSDLSPKGPNQNTNPSPPTPNDAAYFNSTKNLMEKIPHMPSIHRPTKEDLLAAATGFWSRLRLRFKWFSIRSARPFNIDEIGALISWLLLGHVLWIILGTTTFVSLAIIAVNTVFAQETLARWIGNYLTKSSGITVVFESAIVPKWGDGVITFKNVFVSRRPGHGSAKVRKGSPETAAAAAVAATAAADTLKTNDDGNELEEDTNYTQFDLMIDTVDVTLSFTRWFNSKGLLRDVQIKGVRGVLDRQQVRFNNLDVDPKIYRHEHNPGDFELESFKLEDLLVTVHQPGNFRPFSVSIFSCDLPQLRRQWMFYDFLCANNVSGSFDESLFTIHPRQMHSRVGMGPLAYESEMKTDPWKKHSRLRIDGLNIDHLNRGIEGPFSWIYEGNVDIVADVLFPTDSDESITKVMSDFYDQLESALTSKLRLPRIYDKSSLPDQVISTEETPPKPESHSSSRQEEDRKFLVMDMRINFNDVHAAVPLFTKDLSYVNNALIRPIVAYINTRRTFIPINCRVVKRANDFDGSWTLYDSGLLDDLSAETYTAIVKDVADDQARMRRFKKVGLWSLQLAVQALFMGMAGNIA